MPCSKCGTELIFIKQNPECANCKQLNLLTRNQAIPIAKKWVELLRESWLQILHPYNKDTLIPAIAWEREKYSRSLVNVEYSSIDIGHFFDTSFIIRESMKHSASKTAGLVNSRSLKDIIEVTDMLNLVENTYSKILSGYSNIILKEPLSGHELTRGELSKLTIVENESYEYMRKMFADQDIFTDEEGKKKEEEILKSMEHRPREYRSYTSKEFITTCYPLMLSLYGGLTKNSFYAKNFDLRHFKEVFKDPSDLMKFVWKFPKNDSHPTYVPLDKFIEKSQIVLNVSKHKIMKYLIFSQRNPDIFPLFVAIEINCKKYVIISHLFAYHIYAILHVVITKPLFDAETERLSKKFEQDVKIEFEKRGYTYRANVIDKSSPNLEIDGIAINDDHCYVIECKAWRFPHLAEEFTKKEQIIRELRGIVDGTKFSIVRLKPSTIRKKSLLEKIQFVIINKDQFDIHRNSDVRGLIVTLIQPPIQEYKGIKVISIKQIMSIT